MTGGAVMALVGIVLIIRSESADHEIAALLGGVLLLFVGYLLLLP